MMPAWVAAAMLTQGAIAEVFAETEGWSIARHAGGCLMTREFGGTGNTIVTFSVDPTDTSAPLTILVGNSGWALPDADDEGYRIEFSGSEAVWKDLAVRTFTTDDDAAVAADLQEGVEQGLAVGSAQVRPVAARPQAPGQGEPDAGPAADQQGPPADPLPLSVTRHASPDRERPAGRQP